MPSNQNNNKKQRGQGIVRVSNLFDKYKKTLRAPQKTVINTFIEVVQELYGMTVRPDQCAYSPQSQTLTLRASGMLKTEVRLGKKHIINYMREKLGEKNAPKEIL
jgi:protoporphyrinogen oxidase